MTTQAIVSTKVYLAVYVALLVLLALTVGVSYVELEAWNFIVAASIATVKAVLIVLYFMHARYSPHLIWLVAGAGAFWLAIMIGLTLSDYWTRGWTPFSEILDPTAAEAPE